MVHLWARGFFNYLARSWCTALHCIALMTRVGDGATGDQDDPPWPKTTHPAGSARRLVVKQGPLYGDADGIVVENGLSQETGFGCVLARALRLVQSKVARPITHQLLGSQDARRQTVNPQA